MRLLKVLLKVFLVLALLVALFDVAMAIAARYEHASDWGPREEWVSSDRIVEPTGPAAGRSVILVHGFAGCPRDFLPLYEPLAAAGFRVVAPLVPGQTKACPAGERGNFTSEILVEWLRGVVRQETAVSGRPPYLVGFSMGGALATIVAAEGMVDRLVLVAPYYRLATAPDILATLAGVVGTVAPLLPVPPIARGRINDPEGSRQYHPGTWILSLPAFLELNRTSLWAKGIAFDITVPTLVLASPNDEVASFKAMEEALSEIEDAEFRLYPRSNHVLFWDYDREAAARAVVEFLTR